MRRLLLLLITACKIGRSLAAPLPTVLMGNWQVAQVGTDTWITSSDNIVPNDPYLIGRHVIISQAEISSPMSYLADCSSPEIDSAPDVSLDKLVALTEGERQSEPVKPIAKDYDLAFSGSQHVTPLMLHCKKGNFASEGANIKPWLVVADKNTLLVSGNMSSILTLKRIIDERPSPSFNCRKVQQDDEKAICISFDLATWDKSVNKAYRAALWQLKQAKNKHELNEVMHSQQIWIKKRADCNTDSRCLYQSMFDRIGVLRKYY